MVCEDDEFLALNRVLKLLHGRGDGEEFLIKG